MLDFNCAIILIPVCRTFIRYLYDLSTQSQTATQKLLRTVLQVFPLDKVQTTGVGAPGRVHMCCLLDRH